MLDLDFKFLKQKFIWEQLQRIADERWITQTDIGKKIWVVPQWIWPVLKWKRQASEDKMRQIAKAIWLSDRVIEDIIFEAKKQALEYEYPERFKSKWGLTDEEKELLKQIPEDVKVAFSKTWDLKQSDIDQIAWIIEFLKSKRN